MVVYLTIGLDWRTCLKPQDHNRWMYSKAKVVKTPMWDGTDKC